jgi:hypothetical protein
MGYLGYFGVFLVQQKEKQSTSRQRAPIGQIKTKQYLRKSQVV